LKEGFKNNLRGKLAKKKEKDSWSKNEGGEDVYIHAMPRLSMPILFSKSYLNLARKSQQLETVSQKRNRFIQDACRVSPLCLINPQRGVNVIKKRI